VDLAGGDERFELAAGRQACECQATRHRLVGNCVACGRVVCQQEGPGPCLFCGALVGVGSSEGGGGQGRGGGAAVAAATGPAPSDAERKAVAFKETLLTYDREASKRTTVIDDQSDFFEIESNAWLSKEEKGELMQRQRILEEAEERRRRDFRVTIDLVGKQVMAAPCEEENVEGNRLAFVTREAAGTAGGAGAAAAPTPARGARDGGGEGTAGGARPAPPEDGPGQLAAGMMPNPGLVGKAPSYVSKDKGGQGKKGRRKKGGGRPGAQDEAAAEPSRRPREPEHRRVQDDAPF